MIHLGLDEAKIPREKYYIVPIPDTDIHQTWVSIVEMLVPDFDLVYSNDPLTRTLFEEANYKVASIPLYKREIFSGEEFRRRVINNENWRALVPNSVADFLIKNKLIDRLKKLSQSDKPHKNILFLL
jgi:nicotinamide-nucleotide adenylyltransferase